MASASWAWPLLAVQDATGLVVVAAQTALVHTARPTSFALPLPSPPLPPPLTPQVERPITNQTYILRLHVTTQMASLLFPPRAELEAAYQVAASLEPPSGGGAGGASRSHSAGSTYTQLFKQRLTVVDEGGLAWPVQVRGALHARAWSRASAGIPGAAPGR